ncbi:unnamed protein product, partial [Symbiodinium sp. CCMP2456]
ARRLAEAEAHTQRLEEEAQQRAAEAEHRREQEARQLAEAEVEAERKSEEEARRRAEAEVERKREEEARQRAAAEAERQREEEARQRAEAEAERKRKEEARRLAEAEAEFKRKEEEVRRRAEAEEEQKRREEAQRAAEAAKLLEEEARQRAEAAEAARAVAEAEAALRAREEQQSSRRHSDPEAVIPWPRGNQGGDTGSTSTQKTAAEHAEELRHWAGELRRWAEEEERSRSRRSQSSQSAAPPDADDADGPAFEEVPSWTFDGQIGGVAAPDPWESATSKPSHSEVHPWPTRTVEEPALASREPPKRSETVSSAPAAEPEASKSPQSFLGSEEDFAKRHEAAMRFVEALKSATQAGDTAGWPNAMPGSKPEVVEDSWAAPKPAERSGDCVFQPAAPAPPLRP